MPYIIGTDGDDEIVGFAFNDEWWIDGGDGDDFLSGWNGDDWLWGGTGNDILVGEAGDDHLYGGTGDDFLFGGQGYSDLLMGGDGADLLDGGDGNFDTAGYGDSDAAVTVNLALGAGSGGHAEGDVLIGIENLSGSAYDDTLTGDGSGNTLTGSWGSDVMNGGGGNDTLDGGDGEDTLLGGDGDDTFKGGDGIDVLKGGDGSDTADYSDSFDSISVSLESGAASGGTAEGDFLQDIENVIGGWDDDMLDGNKADNVLNGGNFGDDTLEGFEGADVLMGGNYIDPLYDFDGYLMSLAVGGIDTASYEGSDAGVHVELSPKGNWEVGTPFTFEDASGHGYGGHAEGDLLFSIENVIGSQHNDSLFGSDDTNVLKGMDGHDTLYGFGGSDILDGGDGDDTLVGGDKDDTLIGGLGVDTMNGEDGADMFKFLSEKDCGISTATADQLFDFNESAGDQIDLSAIDADSTTSRSHEAFKFIGNVSFTGVGQVRYNDGGYVEGNTDADLDPEFYIALNIGLTPAMSDDGFVFV